MRSYRANGYGMTGHDARLDVEELESGLHFVDGVPSERHVRSKLVEHIGRSVLLDHVNLLCSQGLRQDLYPIRDGLVRNHVLGKLSRQQIAPLLQAWSHVNVPHGVVSRYGDATKINRTGLSIRINDPGGPERGKQAEREENWVSAQNCRA